MMTASAALKSTVARVCTAVMMPKVLRFFAGDGSQRRTAVSAVITLALRRYFWAFPVF